MVESRKERKSFAKMRNSTQGSIPLAAMSTQRKEGCHAQLEKRPLPLSPEGRWHGSELRAGLNMERTWMTGETEGREETEGGRGKEGVRQSADATNTYAAAAASYCKVVIDFPGSSPGVEKREHHHAENEQQPSSQTEQAERKRLRSLTTAHSSYRHLTVPSPPTPPPTPSLYFHPTPNTSNYVSFSPPLKHPRSPFHTCQSNPYSIDAAAAGPAAPRTHQAYPPSAVRTINGPIPNLFIVQKPAKQPRSTLRRILAGQNRTPPPKKQQKPKPQQT
ncbi:Protein of unknown function [Pyronema omphalodes CBS 100304]|uniref:Uncharacterized protein n=1 Tax=Pyronema omphalodes (strain CBS 100304) TaxID=1076935 RepID=U4LD22_PYROM|nr:Protein of unknown function [Pyronema omphalodes CBS 100304]